MLRKLVATTAFAAVTAIASQAGAVVIDSASYTLAGCLGAASCTIGVATLTAQPSLDGAVFAEQDFPTGNKGLGIEYIDTGQPRDPEIQGDPNPNRENPAPEGVEISFASPQIVTEIQLAQFYNSEHFPSDPPASGEPDETAIINLATLLVFGDSSAEHLALGFDPLATFTLLDADKGLWQILDPFGSTALTSLSFTALNSPTTSGDNSDYSIGLITTSDVVAEPVPEPTTLGLIGIGLVGLGLVGRRFRRSAVANK